MRHAPLFSRRSRAPRLTASPQPWRRLVLGAAVAAAVVALGGCAGTTMPALKPTLPAQWRHALPAEAPASTDLHGWWHAFGDPQLDQLVDAALGSNLQVAQAVERLRAARALRSRATAQYLPQLHARTNDTIDPDASASFFVAGFDATWELGLFGRRKASRRMAQGALDDATADLRAARVSLVAEVAREWLQLRAAAEREQVLGAIRDARQRQLDLLQVRQRLQLVPAAGVDQARAALAQAQAALAEPREAADAGAQRLAVLLGRDEPDPRWLQLPAQPLALGAIRVDSAPADLLRARPDIAKAEAAVLQAAGEAGLARAERFPNIALGGSLVWSTDITSNRQHSVSQGVGSLGPLIDIPLFDWGLRAAQAHAKQHELRASVLAYRQTVLQGVAEVETALGALASQREHEAQCATAAQALQRVDDATGKRVALQLASPLERQDSRIAREQATLALDEAHSARALAYVALFKALGGSPLPAPSAETPAAPVQGAAE